MLHAKDLPNRENQQKGKEQAQAMLLAMASLGILRKLGNAFWNAFLVGSGSIWDTDKTKRALEGNIVLNLLMSIGPYPLLLLLLRSLLLRWLRVRVCQ